MHSATFDCEVITPMFLAGSNKNTPELRAPSIRGTLRWWFRAVAGGYVADHKEVRRLESCLFGDPSDQKGASSVVVHVRCNDFNKEKKDMLPHRPTAQDRSPTWCIPEGTLFKATLKESAYNPAPHALEAAKALFELFATLGGLGRRVRRSFGAFQPVGWSFEDETKVQQHIEAKVKAACKAIERFIDAHPPPDSKTTQTPPAFGANAVADYPILHPKVVWIRVGSATDWVSFIKVLMPECSKLKHTDARVLGRGSPRQASTLLVSVVQVNSSRLVPIYTQFYCNTVDKKGPVLMPKVKRNNPNEFAKLENLPATVSSPLLSVSLL